jgi:NAD(P)-dependent dehydrogenase (short-subunit alcohol dehydrogenase family)
MADPAGNPTGSRQLEDKVALVTGSTSGIGAQMARSLAGDGAHVVVTGRREKRGNAIVDEVRQAGGEATFLQLDITSEESVADVFDTVRAKFGRLDVLVNNAAPLDLLTHGTDKPAGGQTTAEFDSIVKPIMYGTYWASQRAVGLMAENSGGSIIHISSIASVLGVPSTPAYTMAKGAVNAFSRQLAVDYADAGIRSNVIIVGLVLSGAFVTKMQADRRVGPILENATLTRPGKPQDIANLVGFLAGDKSEFITGTVMTADGGMTCSRDLPDLSQPFT